MAPPKDPYRYFRLEARELVDRFGSGIIELEKGGSADLIQQLLRHAHTLKGAARVVKQPDIANHAHAIEDLLSPFSDSVGHVSREAIAALLAHVDDIRERIQDLSPAEPAVEAGRAAPVPDAGLRTIRADIGEMDMLLDGVSETYAHLTGLRSVARAVEQAQNLTNLLLAHLAPRSAGDPDQQPAANRDRAYFMAEELWESFGGLERGLGSAIEQMDRELRQLRDTAEQMRLVPAELLFTSLERTASDAARALGKQVVFEGRGGDIRLDADVLEAVQSAFVQLVRNAVVHGIEDQAERRAAAKPAAGRLTVDVTRRGGRVLFECRDDGRGIDVEAIRRIAVDRGLAGAEVRRADAADVLQMLMRGGISTADNVTQFAGRGVGLDIVRDAIERLKGDVAVRSESGRGTTFTVAMPLSLSSIEALTVEQSGMVVAIPLDAVRSSMRITAAQISHTAEGASVVHDGAAIPFVPLSRFFHGTRVQAGGNWSAIVVAGTGGLAAIGVERLLGTARIVIRPLPPHMFADPVVAGASLDAEGNPQLVLDANALVATAIQGDGSHLEPSPASDPILIIDDSLTTRMLEQSILESAGYEVDAALSAEDGLEAARKRRYSLFLVDVEMPGMDGFAFVERIRADPVLHGIPAILVTSRNAPEDLQRGQDAGAQGYIVKGDFDQNKLLALIRELAG
jgi:two-component system chemotaxis sensor kinase CheA